MRKFRFGVKNIKPLASQDSRNGEVWYYPIKDTYAVNPFPNFSFETLREAHKWRKKISEWARGDIRVISVDTYLQMLKEEKNRDKN